MDSPAVKSGMVENNAALRNDFFEITQTQGMHQIPAETQSNNINEIMKAFKRSTDQRHCQVTHEKKQHIT